jgi:hypothetical protein
MRPFPTEKSNIFAGAFFVSRRAVQGFGENRRLPVLCCLFYMFFTFERSIDSIWLKN